MTAPTLEPLSEEELAWLDREKQAGATIVGRLVAEVRAHRAAALSDEDKALLRRLYELELRFGQDHDTTVVARSLLVRLGALEGGT